MQVVMAPVLGYCMGVRRAVECAESALAAPHDGGCVYTLGPLIHNPQVLSSLARRGLRVLDEQGIQVLTPRDTVIVRAHGTTPQTERLLRDTGATVIDATCPRVHGSQHIAAKWSAQGYAVIIAGDRNHGEVTGIAGHSGGACTVIQSEEEAARADVPQKAVLLAQTTFSPALFARIADVLRQKSPALTVFDTICTATLERQNALAAVGQVDGILVIGGATSANTRRLYETALTLAPRAALIEDEAQIPQDFFAMARVGLTAGASTPAHAIDRAKACLLSGATGRAPATGQSVTNHG